MPGSGSVQLRALAVELKVQAAGGLRVQLMRGVKNAAKPLVPAFRDAARAQLPQSGGLAARVAASPIKVQYRTGASTAGVRIVASEHDTRPTNFGQVRHPVFGHMDRWVSQDIPAAKGWWTDTGKANGPQATAEILKVMAEVAAQLTRGV